MGNNQILWLVILWAGMAVANPRLFPEQRPWVPEWHQRLDSEGPWASGCVAPLSRKEIRVIVVLEGAPLARKLRLTSQRGLPFKQLRASYVAWSRAQAEQRRELIRQWRAQGHLMRVTRQFGYLLNGMALVIQPHAWPALKRDPRVKALYLDGEVKAHLDESVALTGAPTVWDLKDAMGLPVRGEGQVIAILDTGIDYQHPDLGGGIGPSFKVIGGYDFVDDDEDPMDLHGHGTHVAGIAAANGAVTGVAPDAKLMAFRVLNEFGGGQQSDIIAGLERAADPDGDPLTPDAPTVLNMSLGGVGDADDPVSQAVDEAVAAGVVVVVSAGNAGPEFQTMGSPAASRGAITVGSIDKRDGLSFFSSRGPALPFELKPDLVAPGEQIRSTLLGGTHGPESGTSMSSPHVAGAAALIRQLYPGWEPERVKRRLVHTARRGETDIFAWGAGRLDLAAAVTAVVEIQGEALNYQRIDHQQSQVVESRVLMLANPTQQPKQVRLETSALPGGMSFRFSESLLTLAPGETREVTITLELNNEVLAFPSNRGLVFMGHVLVQHESQTHVVPFGLRKALTLELDFGQDGFYVYKLVDPGGDLDQFQFTNVAKGSLFLRPGPYTLLGWADPFPLPEDPTASLRYVYGLELQLETDQKLFLGKDKGNLAVETMLHDARGITYEWHTRPGEWVGLLTHLPSEEFLLVSGLTQDETLRFTRLSEDFHFQLIGFHDLESESGFTEFGYQFQGLSQSKVVDYDLTQNKRLTFVVPATEHPEDRIIFSQNIQNENAFFSRFIFNFLDLLEGRVGEKAPLEFVVNAMPQGSGETPSHQMAYRQLQANIFRDDFFEFGSTTPIHKVIDSRRLLAQGGYLIPDTEQAYTTIADRIMIGQSPIFPLLETDNQDQQLSIRARAVSPFTDPWENDIASVGLSFTMDLPGTDTLTGQSMDELEDALYSSLASPGDVALDIRFSNRLTGQAMDAQYRIKFNTAGEDTNPPFIRSLRILNDGQPSETLVGEGEVELDVVDDTGLAHLALAVDAGDGWLDLDLQPAVRGSRATLPELPSGATISLRIEAEDAVGNALHYETAGAFRTGFAQIIPWVVNNPRWQSRIALFNQSETDAPVTLRATTGSGAVLSRDLVVRANGVMAVAASELFGELTGYSLKVSSAANALYASFLTFNKEPISGGNSPSQTTASSVGGLTSRLLFPYVPGSQLPAIVLMAPEQFQAGTEATTPVGLQLFDDQAGLIAEMTIFLKGTRPEALLVHGLFQGIELPENAALLAHAENGTKIAGTTFTFNHQAEPSMAAALSQIHRISHSHLIPWVVNNDQWSSRLAIYNQSQQAARVHLRAVTTEGQQEQIEVAILPRSVAAFDAEELFLLSGYVLSVDSATADADLYTSFLTFNREPTSGGNSPSQTTGIPPGELHSTLIFGYVPTDQISALVLVAPQTRIETQVRITAYGPQGEVAQTTLSLRDKQPVASLVKNLFPGKELPADLAIVATSENGVGLGGTTFIFNHQGEPSMAKPFPSRIP